MLVVTGNPLTLLHFARATPGNRMLYLTCNQAVREAVAQKIPFTVESKASHHLALPGFGRSLGFRLTCRLHITNIAGLLNTCRRALARTTQGTLNLLQRSACAYPGLRGMTLLKIPGTAQVLQRVAINNLVRAWMNTPEMTEENDAPVA
jgi:hypothetical protein